MFYIPNGVLQISSHNIYKSKGIIPVLKAIVSVTTLCAWTLTLPSATAQVELEGPTGYSPPVAEASNEGEKAIRRFPQKTAQLHLGKK